MDNFCLLLRQWNYLPRRLCRRWRWFHGCAILNNHTAYLCFVYSIHSYQNISCTCFFRMDQTTAEKLNDIIVTGCPVKGCIDFVSIQFQVQFLLLSHFQYNIILIQSEIFRSVCFLILKIFWNRNNMDNQFGRDTISCRNGNRCRSCFDCHPITWVWLYIIRIFIIWFL